VQRRRVGVASRETIVGNFLYSAAVAFFWFSDMRAMRGYAWTPLQSVWVGPSEDFLSIYLSMWTYSVYLFGSAR
jgi:hypothetical protein